MSAPRRNPAPRRAALLVCIASLLAASWGCRPAPVEEIAPEPDVPDLVTRAEASGFLATSSYDETLAWLDRLAASWPKMRVTSYGTSSEGRALPLVIVSADEAFTPEAAHAGGKPVVLVQNGIHAGEIDGKDASLMLLRELAAGEHDELLDAMTLLVMPIYNVDGHERVSPFHRPNQDGPREGTGFRTTASGLDLNRDHLKLDAPETRALARLATRWGPHLHVDNHVTDGVDHEWVVTWSRLFEPQIAAPVSSWLDAAIAEAERATQDAGFPTGPYVSLVDRLDPAQGFDSWVGPPRYSTGYFGLRGIPSVLVEMHSYKPYEQRVRGNRAFLLALLREVARRPSELRDAVRASREAVVRLGRPGAPPSRLAVSWEPDREAFESIRWPVHAWSVRRSPVFGDLLAFERDTPAPIDVRWYSRGRVRHDVARPRGYIVMPGWPAIASRVLDHGLAAYCLTEDVELEVETLRLADPALAPRSYQGRVALDARVTRRVERRLVPSGALWIPADQPDFELAAQLLEPDAPDSLVAWGVLHSIVERKEYIGLELLDRLVAEMLEDPEIAAEWEAARRDPDVSSRPGFPYEWWYRKTAYWDETVGLVPVYRVLHPPSFAARDARAPGS